MMIGRNDPCWCGSGKKWKKCHFPTKGIPSFETQRQEYKKKYNILLKTEKEIEKIRQACHLTAKILEEVCAHAKEGVTTRQLDILSNQLHEEAGAKPAALHYGSPPFPAGICTSLNDVICHGIPNDVPLQKGDILNIDIASIYQGFYGDCSMMVVIDQTTPERQNVVDTAYECLVKAVGVCKPGVFIQEIGKTIEKHAKAKGCSVVYQFVGHGVGVAFHESPQVSHHFVPMAIPLAVGMTFTIEPMINGGQAEAFIEEENEWVARTVDGSPSAQWEYTLLITPEGCEILTPWRPLLYPNGKSARAINRFP